MLRHLPVVGARHLPLTVTPGGCRLDVTALDDKRSVWDEFGITVYAKVNYLTLTRTLSGSAAKIERLQPRCRRDRRTHLAGSGNL